MSCRSFPKNTYFLRCIELFGRSQFERRSMFKSLLLSTRCLDAASLATADRDAAPQLVAWIKYLIFEIKSGASSSCLVAAFNDALLLPDCRHNVAFWRLFLCFLCFDHHRQFGASNAVQIAADRQVESDRMSRYQRQRLQRQRQLELDKKQQSLDRLKGVVMMSMQTVTRSSLLYRFALDILRRHCDDKEMAEYERFVATKRVNLEEEVL